MKNPAKSNREVLADILSHCISKGEYSIAFSMMLKLLLKHKDTESCIVHFVLSFRQFESKGKTSKRIATFNQLCIKTLTQVDSDVIDSYILEMSFKKHDNVSYIPISQNTNICKPLILVVNQGNVIVSIEDSCFASEKESNHIYIVKLSTNKRNVAIAYEKEIKEYADYPVLHLKETDSNNRSVTSIVLLDFKGFRFFCKPNCYKGDIRFTLIDSQMIDLLI